MHPWSYGLYKSGVHNLTIVMMVVNYLWCAVAKAAMTLSLACDFQFGNLGLGGLCVCLQTVIQSLKVVLVHYCLLVWTDLDSVPIHASDDNGLIFHLKCLESVFLMLEYIIFPKSIKGLSVWCI